MMGESGKQVCGFRSMLFYEPSTQTLTKYFSGSLFALGTSLMYTREFWKLNPFPESTRGMAEDYWFKERAIDSNELVCEDVNGRMVARIHDDNTSKKDASGYQRLSLDHLPVGFPR
jgi:hypothetical protein